MLFSKDSTVSFFRVCKHLLFDSFSLILLFAKSIFNRDIYVLNMLGFLEIKKEVCYLLVLKTWCYLCLLLLKFLWFDCSMSLVENNRNVYLSYELYLFFKCFVVYGKGVI
ncbi:hypothetical protein Hanom_Chr13g01188361 [Helianthus anomalus]